jgi:hypothetical protein
MSPIAVRLHFRHALCDDGTALERHVADKTGFQDIADAEDGENKQGSEGNPWSESANVSHCNEG